MNASLPAMRSALLAPLLLTGCYLRLGGGMRAPLDDAGDAQGYLEIAVGGRVEVAPGRARAGAGGFAGGAGLDGGLAAYGGAELGGAVAWRRGGKGHVAARLGAARIEPEAEEGARRDPGTIYTAFAGVASMASCSDTLCLDEDGGLGFAGLAVGLSGALVSLPSGDAGFVGAELSVVIDPLHVFTIRGRD